MHSHNRRRRGPGVPDAAAGVIEGEADSRFRTWSVKSEGRPAKREDKDDGAFCGNPKDLKAAVLKEPQALTA